MATPAAAPAAPAGGGFSFGAPASATPAAFGAAAAAPAAAAPLFGAATPAAPAPAALSFGAPAAAAPAPLFGAPAAATPPPAATGGLFGAPAAAAPAAVPAAGGLFGAAAPAAAAAAPTLSFGAPAAAPAAAAPLFGAAPAPAAAPLFGAAKPAAAAAAPSLAFGAAAPAAAPAGGLFGAAPAASAPQQQLAAVPAPPADVRNKSVEEIVAGWKTGLEADVAEFTAQTEQLREWENEIRASQQEIVEVSAYAEKLVVAQQRTEKVLGEVRAYQDDLDSDLDAMERHVDDLFSRSAVRPPLDADVEREHAYDLSVRLETQLGGMLDQLKDVVGTLNGAHEQQAGDEKNRDIMKIVNAHHQSLAYLSSQAVKVEAEVVKLERVNEAERRAQAAV